jgi:hypothetical protein
MRISSRCVMFMESVAFVSLMLLSPAQAGGVSVAGISLGVGGHGLSVSTGSSGIAGLGGVSSGINVGVGGGGIGVSAAGANVGVGSGAIGVGVGGSGASVGSGGFRAGSGAALGEPSATVAEAIPQDFFRAPRSLVPEVAILQALALFLPDNGAAQGSPDITIAVVWLHRASPAIAWSL